VNPTPNRASGPAHTHEARTLDALLTMRPEELAAVDIAEMNLLCAAGLPGAEDLDIATCLARLDRWAARVKAETERHLYRLTDPRYADHAAHYKHSEARFRAEWLVNVLQQDIGAHYFAGFTPPDKPVVLPKTSKECFIHGLLDHEDARKAFGGNCLSLPVVYAAVGRRLGYPVKLVCSLEHAFCRWEGTGHANPAWRDRFNFDGAGDGFSIDPDEFYLSWPRKYDGRLVELCDWLTSLTPEQELALFLAHRGLVLRAVAGDDVGALVVYSHVVRLWPTSRSSLQEVQTTLDRLWAREVTAHADIYRRKFGVEVVDGRVAPVRRATREQDTFSATEMIEEYDRQRGQHLAPPVVPVPGLPRRPDARGLLPQNPYSPYPPVPQPPR